MVQSCNHAIERTASRCKTIGDLDLVLLELCHLEHRILDELDLVLGLLLLVVLDAAQFKCSETHAISGEASRASACE